MYANAIETDRLVQREKKLASGVKANASTAARTMIRIVWVKWLRTHSASTAMASQASTMQGKISARSHTPGMPRPACNCGITVSILA